MAQQPLSILISGAGVAGASLALTLARQPGFKTIPHITLVERSPVPRTTGQAVDIRALGVDVIRRLGLEPDIKARHTTESGLAILNGKGNIVAELPRTGDAKNQSASSEYEILRGDLAGLLLDGVNEAKERGVNVDVVYGESIENIEEREDGSGVDVYFANGKLANQKFDVVIGADGIASKTRACMFGKKDLKEFVEPSGMYIAFFSIPRIPSDDRLWRWSAMPGGMGMHLRPHCNGKTMGVYFTICNNKPARDPELEDVLHSDVASQKAYFKQRFQGKEWQTARFLEGLEKSEDFYCTHWCRVITPQWAKGHCVTVGDAAFATMGIGTSLAMIGAYCISGELAKITSPSDVPDALQKYEACFRPYVEKHQGYNFGGMQLANLQSAWGLWIFHVLVKVMVALHIPQLLMRFFGGEGKEAWKLPEYGWEDEKVAK
ncbi:FAD/NAD(P)-binding domain-containing protein [Setomelanomma holmii]|uniref:FAD/NAD(P)-binding domain-containing protein n=1 Tax=Setomelanomma holmii TaxID=210430 RepID=A0A9P4GZ19_9PLEO|nr:FAD/NAD(P)-binding domain-containing protein [Setomelanomma holmii]